MGWLKTITGWATGAWKTLFGGFGDVAKFSAAIWKYVTSVFKAVLWVITHPVQAIAIAFGLLHTLEIDVLHAIASMAHRIRAWIWLNFIRPTRQWTLRHIRRLRRWTAYRFVQAYILMFALYRAARRYALHLVKMEAHRRRQGDKNERAIMLRHVKAAVQLIQREAASGYNAELHGRLGVIARLAELAGVRNPLVRGLVGRLIAGLIDLIGVENPVARIALGFIMRDIVNRMGIEKPIASLADDLLAPILGQPKPKTLHDVIRDLSQRVGKMEQQWSQFMHDGGSEVLQAGREWQGITSLLADAGLLAFTGQMVVSPDAWAREISGVLGDPVNAAMSGMADLIKKA